MTVFLKLILESGEEVGILPVSNIPPKEYLVPYGGKTYRILKGQVLPPRPDHHVADGLLLTVELTKEGG